MTSRTKALLRILIQELRVNSRAEILPAYRIATPTVWATNSSVERTWRRANHATFGVGALDLR